MENKNVVELSNVQELAKAIVKEQNKIAWKNAAITMGATFLAGAISVGVGAIRKSLVTKKLDKNEEEIGEDPEE